MDLINATTLKLLFTMENTQAMKKKNKLVIVGCGETCSIAMEIAVSQGSYEICGFSQEAASSEQGSHLGLPLVPLQDIRTYFPPEEYQVFVAISFVWLNQSRCRIYQQLNAQHYVFANIISPLAYVSPSAQLGNNLLIYDFASVGTSSIIGNNATLCSHSIVSHSSHIGAHCYLAAGATTGGFCQTGERCFIGLQATLSDQSHLQDDSIVSATSFLPKGKHASGLYVGNPAKRQEIDMNDFLRLKRGML